MNRYVFAERNWHDSDEHMRCIRSGKYKLIINAYIELPHGITGDYTRSAAWKSLRKGHKKGTLTPGQSRIFEVPRYTVELYDLHNDPYELNNLSGDMPDSETGQKLMGIIKDWMKETRDYSPNRKRMPDDIDRVTGFRLRDIYDMEYYE